MSVVNDAAGKPRLLLSIVKCACFEHLGEMETLFTAITAGFGRFECERLLKPSGVELMNLPVTANIEVCVMRRDPGTGQKHLLHHGLVPLASVSPVFNAIIPGEPQVWESWVGLFSSDVSLKDQSPDRLFQRCLEMGTSSARFPRLLIRMQHLQSTPAPNPAPLPASVPPPRPVQVVGSRFASERDGVWANAGPAVAGVPQTSPGQSLRPERVAPFAFEPAGAKASTAQRSTSRSAHSDQCGGSFDWRVKYEELANRMSDSQAMWDEKRQALELALRDAEKSAYHKAESGVVRSDHPNGRPTGPLAPAHDDGGESEQRGPHKLAAYVKQCGELHKQVSELQRNILHLERDNLRLHEADSQQENSENLQHQLLESLGPALKQCGRPISAASTSDAILADVGAALSERAPLGRAAQPPLALLEDAWSRAAEGGGDAFEAWLTQDLETDARQLLEAGAPGLIANCMKVPKRRQPDRHCIPETHWSAPYLPVKADPIDCLWAAELLRLTAAPPDVARLKPGIYRFGPHGLRLSCNMSSRGTVMVQVASEEAGCAAEGGPVGPIELRQFLTEQWPVPSAS